MHQKPIPRPGTLAERQALGRAIRELRATHSLSQADLAHRSRTCRDHIRAVEHGEITPTFHNLVWMLDALDITLAELVGAYNRQATPSKHR
jgi:transcriptional regulator with XRE-family HTH domain